MKDTFKTIKEHFILLLGAGLFTCGLFNFDSNYYLGKTGGLGISGLGAPASSYPIATYYYYNNISLILLTVGVILMVIGILKMRKKKDEN